MVCGRVGGSLLCFPYASGTWEWEGEKILPRNLGKTIQLYLKTFQTGKVGTSVGEGLFVRDGINKKPFKLAQVKKKVN